MKNKINGVLIFGFVFWLIANIYLGTSCGIVLLTQSIDNVALYLVVLSNVIIGFASCIVLIGLGKGNYL